MSGNSGNLKCLICLKTNFLKSLKYQMLSYKIKYINEDNDVDDTTDKYLCVQCTEELNISYNFKRKLIQAQKNNTSHKQIMASNVEEASNEPENSNIHKKMKYESICVKEEEEEMTVLESDLVVYAEIKTEFDSANTVTTHSKDSEEPCFKCKEVFKDIRSLNEHQKIKHSKSAFKWQ